MRKQPYSVLVVAREAQARAEIARLLLPLNCRIELSSNEGAARKLMRKERFIGVVIASDGLDVSELPFVIEMHGAVRRLAILTDEIKKARKFAVAFPDALICGSQPLEPEKLLSFFQKLDVLK